MEPYRLFLTASILLALVQAWAPGISEATGQSPASARAVPRPDLEPLRELDRSIRSAAARVMRSVVRVDRLEAQADREGRTAARIPRYFSGIVVDDGRTVLTVPEAVTGEPHLYVKTARNRSYRAVAMGHDVAAGVGVLRLTDASLAPIELAPATVPPVGSVVLTVGNPFGLIASPSLGIVSGLRQTRTADRFLGLLQLSIAINPGDYGGAVVDAEGRVVGMILSSFRSRGPRPDTDPFSLHDFFAFAKRQRGTDGEGAPSTRSLFFRWLDERGGTWDPPSERPDRPIAARPEVEPSNIHFALPIQSAIAAGRKILREATGGAPGLSQAPGGDAPRERGVRSGWIGFRVRVIPLATEVPGQGRKQQHGLLVVDVHRGGPAARAGIRPLDIVTWLEGRRVASPEALHEALLTKQGGDPIELEVLRNGQPMRKTVLVASPEEVPATETGPDAETAEPETTQSEEDPSGGSKRERRE